MNVTLKNNTAQAIPILLEHPAFRNRASGFRRTQQTVIDQARDGSISPRVVTREEPGSITLPPKGEVAGLHPAIKNCAQVRGLLRRGAVTIIAPKTKTAPPLPARRARTTRKASSQKGADE